MDDKKFDELMKRYVSSTNNSTDKDFRKLNMKDTKKDIKPKTRVYKYAWVISCVLVIAVSLAILLPIYLKDNDPPDGPSEQPPIQYYEDSEIISIPATSINEINAAYQLNIMQPKIENIAETISILCSKEDEDKILGVCIELSVYDEFTDNLYIYAMLSQYSLNTLAAFDTYETSTTWNGYQINYYIEFYEEFSYYIYKMKFGNEDYTYYLEVYRYDEIEIAQLLDIIF